MSGELQSIKLYSAYVIHEDSKLSKISSLKCLGGTILVFCALLISVFLKGERKLEIQKNQFVSHTLFFL